MPDSRAYPPRRAFLVRETYEDGCCVQFARYSVVARRDGANELNTDFSSVECTRYPDFDEYAETGIVPNEVLVEHGWYFHCSHCGRKIEREPTDEEGEPIQLEPIYLKNQVFCGPDCQTAYRFRKEAELARAEQAAQSATARWPGIEVTYKNGHEEPARVCFRFPGGQYTADWRFGAEVIWVSACDKEAWEAFAARIKQTVGSPCQEI